MRFLQLLLFLGYAGAAPAAAAAAAVVAAVAEMHWLINLPVGATARDAHSRFKSAVAATRRQESALAGQALRCVSLPQVVLYASCFLRYPFRSLASFIFYVHMSAVGYAHLVSCSGVIPGRSFSYTP